MLWVEPLVDNFHGNILFKAKAGERMLIGLFVLAGLLLLGFVYEQVSRRRDARRPIAVK